MNIIQILNSLKKLMWMKMLIPRERVRDTIIRN
jgi:hypothetical protein